MNDLNKWLAHANHMLVAGASGSGKSVLVNNWLVECLSEHPMRATFSFIDLKKIELNRYRSIRRCMSYADSATKAVELLAMTCTEMDRRYKRMQRTGKQPAHHYVIIDELADLMLSEQKKAVKNYVQRITQLGRAANVHLIACTQCPLAKVIPTEIKVNFDCVVGLRTRSERDSRNILGINDCADLPRYGKCILDVPEFNRPYEFSVDMSSEADMSRVAHMNKKTIWQRIAG